MYIYVKRIFIYLYKLHANKVKEQNLKILCRKLFPETVQSSEHLHSYENFMRKKTAICIEHDANFMVRVPVQEKKVHSFY